MHIELCLFLAWFWMTCNLLVYNICELKRKKIVSTDIQSEDIAANRQTIGYYTLQGEGKLRQWPFIFFYNSRLLVLFGSCHSFICSQSWNSWHTIPNSIFARRKLFYCDLQQWHSLSVYCFLSVLYLFVRLSLCLSKATHASKFLHCFPLSTFKSVHF